MLIVTSAMFGMKIIWHVFVLIFIDIFHEDNW